MKETLHTRILRALAEYPEGKAGYHALMRKVWPADKYPRAYRHSSNGGPPGVAMIFGERCVSFTRRGWCRGIVSTMTNRVNLTCFCCQQEESNWGQRVNEYHHRGIEACGIG